MEKDTAKKIFVLIILGIFMISFLIEIAMADSDVIINIQGPLAQPVDTTTSYGKFLAFFGGTWVEVIVAIFIAIIIAAALYDILGLTGFTSTAVRILISIGIAGIASLVGAIKSLAGVAFRIAGGISAVGIAIVIGAAVVAFVLLHFGVSWLAVKMLEGRGHIDAARARARAEGGAAVLTGAREGTG